MNFHIRVPAMADVVGNIGEPFDDGYDAWDVQENQDDDSGIREVSRSDGSPSLDRSDDHILNRGARSYSEEA